MNSVGSKITVSLLLAFIVYQIFKKMFMNEIKFIRPVDKKFKTTSPFGVRVHPITGKKTQHNGLDFATPVGTPIKAPLDGVVALAENHPTGGLQMVLTHDNDYRTGYAHLSKFNLKKGDKFKQGDIIGWTGNTGASTGAHLHYSIRHKNIYVNPKNYI